MFSATYLNKKPSKQPKERLAENHLTTILKKLNLFLHQKTTIQRGEGDKSFGKEKLLNAEVI